jgi:predicted GNAT family N-acyltransferase
VAIIIAAMSATFTVRRADWERDRESLRWVRTAVFVDEQSVPLALEWDGLDDNCLHVLAEDSRGAPIGTGRLLPDGHIGRMAVLPAWRGRGVGGAILGELLRCAAAQGLTQVVLNAQTHATGFYARFGFSAEGAAFLDAGIEHRRMRRTLAQANVQAAGAGGRAGES